MENLKDQLINALRSVNIQEVEVSPVVSDKENFVLANYKPNWGDVFISVKRNDVKIILHGGYVLTIVDDCASYKEVYTIHSVFDTGKVIWGESPEIVIPAEVAEPFFNKFYELNQNADPEAIARAIEAFSVHPFDEDHEL